MKKIIAFIMALMIVLSFTVSAESGIKVIVNSQTLALDVEPEIINDRIMVPMRAIFEALGAKVSWNESDKIIVGTTTDKSIALKIGTAAINVIDLTSAESKDISIDAAPFIAFGRTLVPLRAVSEALGASVSWDGNSKIVTINSNRTVQNTIAYYPGTSIPTYDSVTGSPVISTKETKSGRLSYIHEYSSFGINQYEETLKKSGWELFNKEGTDMFAYIKGDEYVVVAGAYIPGLYEEVNITPCKTTGNSNYDGPAYEGTKVPTYESITGDKLVKTEKLSTGDTAYFYKYTKAEYMNYLSYLKDDGWLYLDNDKNVILYYKRENGVRFAFWQDGNSQYVILIPMCLKD